MYTRSRLYVRLFVSVICILMITVYMAWPPAPQTERVVPMEETSDCCSSPVGDEEMPGDACCCSGDECSCDINTCFCCVQLAQPLHRAGWVYDRPSSEGILGLISGQHAESRFIRPPVPPPLAV